MMPLLISILYLQPTVSAEMLQGNVHFIPMKRYEEKDGLPPKLVAVFDVGCHEKLLTTVRYDQDDLENVDHIYVGGLVQDSLISSCVGETREVSMDAGHTFSGRQYKVEGIQNYRQMVVGGKSEPTSKKTQKKK